MPKLESVKRKIIKFGKLLYQKNLVAANNGNISRRLDKNRIMITPSGVSLGFLKEHELVITDIDGNVMKGALEPSSEIQAHLTIYQNRNDVKSVCHAHPIFATVFAVSKTSINSPILTELVINLGKIAEVEYAVPGSDELSQQILGHLQEHDTFLLANHGVITVGDSLTSAYQNMETVEHFAQIRYYSNQLSDLKVLDRAQIQDLEGLRNKFGVRENLNKYEK